MPAASSSTFAVVLPYYNEQDFLPRTLRSWLGQGRRPDQLILVDNGSTDRSAEICRQVVGFPDDVEVIHAREDRAGKTNALETGCARVTCDFVVLSDADTWYPPHYIETCARLAAEAAPGVVCLMALPAQDNPRSASSRVRRGSRVALSKLFSRQGFVGGYGQVMRAEALRKAGGFSARHWNYVLLDHEILNRIFRYGHSLYHMDLWCVPSPRRADRRRVRWNLFERCLYHLTPYRMQDWYFYGFLAPRFERRNLSQLNLREQPWQTSGAPL